MVEHVRAPGAEVPYDEARDGAGRPRPQYATLARRLGWDPLAPPPQVASIVERFGDGTRLVPIPLVIDAAEHRDRVRAGVAQRALALQRFFDDVVLGDGRFLRAGFELTPEILDGILVSEGTSHSELRRHWSGQTRESIGFVYGPDLARAPSGGWLVLEDNVGCVSGCADSFLALDAYRVATGQVDSAARAPDFTAAIRAWLDRAGLTPQDPGVVALLTDAHAARWVNGRRFSEDLRRQHLARRIGLRLVDNEDLERIAVASESGSASLKALINVGVPNDRTWPLILRAFFGAARVRLFNAPGTSVLGNKAFLPFVGRMIAFYLDEEPILAAPPTRILESGLPGEGDSWVVKAAAGCGGTEVFDLAGMTPSERAAISRTVEGSWPTRALVAQRRVELSRLVAADGSSYRVELRALAYTVGWGQVFAGEQSLARLAPIGRDASAPPASLHLAPVVIEE